MARNLLSATQVRTADVGDHSDGEGLYLRVKPAKWNGTTASWVFRYTALLGKRRELGLGAADRSSQEAAGATLRRARSKAEEARPMLGETPPRDPHGGGHRVSDSTRWRAELPSWCRLWAEFVGKMRSSGGPGMLGASPICGRESMHP